MRRGYRHDRGEMRWKFLCRRPLIESGVGTAPHRDSAVAKWLLRKPLNDVAAVGRLLREPLEFAVRVTPAANIEKSKCIIVRREVCGAGDIPARSISLKH